MLPSLWLLRKSNEHISSDKDVIYIFLELISNDKIKFSEDGYCKPPALSDLLEFTEMDIKAASDDAFGYGRDFKGAEKGKALREKMMEENPVNKLEEKVEKMAKGIQNPPKKVVSKVAFVHNSQSDEGESADRFRDNSRFEADLEQEMSSLNQIEWDPPVLTSENYGKVRIEANGLKTRADALQGRRREMQLEQLDNSRMDTDQQENPAEKVQDSDQRKMKELVKEDKRPEAILANELSKKLTDPSKFSVSYINKPEEIPKSKSSM
ncbi:hypothetical protein VP01_3468g1, partial [Puccinia sorghi]